MIMRKLQIALAVLFAALDLSAQGVVSFNNFGATDPQKIYVDGCLLCPGVSLAPVGTQYHVALYYDPLVDQGIDAAFVQIGASAGFGPSPGIFSGGQRTIPVGNGGAVNFQVRGWNRAFGTTYETALAAGGVTGKSVIFRMDTAVGDETVMGVRGTGTFTSGWIGFCICVPEPSSLLLGLITAGALLLLRRLKS